MVIQDNHAICKILLITFKGSVRVWYNNVESGLVTSFNDLCVKLVTHFNISIPTRISSTKLFGITQTYDESTRAYLKQFNEEIIKVKKLIEYAAYEGLINGGKEKTL